MSNKTDTTPHQQKTKPGMPFTKIPEKAKRYIVSNFTFAEHGNWADAEAERQRLKRKYPGDIFHVYCVVEKFENYEDIKL
jgi:hypothetical protein